MKNSSLNNSLNFGLKAQGFGLESIKQWNAILKELSSKDFKLIEFKPKQAENNHWALFLDTASEEIKGGQFKFESFNKYRNKDLEEAFFSSEELDQEFWDGIFKVIRLTGFYIPLDDIKEMNTEVLKSYLKFYSLFLKHFQFKEYFLTLHQSTTLYKDEGESFPAALWFYILCYSNFLRKLKNDFSDLYKLFGNWFTEKLKLNNFHQRLPSEQVIILLSIDVNLWLLNRKSHGKKCLAFQEDLKMLLHFLKILMLR